MYYTFRWGRAGRINANKWLGRWPMAEERIKGSSRGLHAQIDSRIDSTPAPTCKTRKYFHSHGRIGIDST